MSSSESSQYIKLPLIAIIITIISASPFSFTSIPNAAAEAQFDGTRSLGASANSRSEENGITTVIGLGAADNKPMVNDDETKKDTPTSTASIRIRQFTFETICDEFGECFESQVFLMRLDAPLTANQTLILAPDDFEPTNQLRDATLSLEVEGFDTVSGTEKNIEVNLEWTGTGETFRGSDIRKVELADDCKIIARDSDALRFATVEGTVSIDGESLATPDFQGILFRSNNLSTFIQC